MCDRHSCVHRSPEAKRPPIFSPSLSQSSVDHKEFKRCGPFDPYINAKVCTHSAAENLFFLFESALLLSCCVGLLCCAVLCLGLFCWLLFAGGHYAAGIIFTTSWTVSVLFYFFFSSPAPWGKHFFSQSASSNSLKLKVGSFHMLKCCIWH